MTPTQAQIEAAAVELSNEHPHWPWECCLEIAKMYLLKHGYCEEIAALTAAAEAGCGCIYPQDCADKISATIKRCAQELEHRAKQTGGHSQYVLLEAAAAIRALKDQAPHSFEDNPLDWRRP